MALVWTWEFPAESAERVDRALARALEDSLGEWQPEAPEALLSRSQIQRLIEENRITVNGQPVRSNARLSPGSRIRLELPAPRPLALVPEDRPLEILYEDEHLVVVNKPPGLTVHPSETQMEGTLVHALLHHIKDLSGIGGVLRPGIVHRIDKDTSGALVITKTDLAHQGLVEIFSKHAIERRYWSICYGVPKIQSEQRIESLIGRNPTDRKKMSMQVKEGRKAVTYVRVLERFPSTGVAPCASLIEARLETGRTHQVRVHLTGLGHSLLGDPVYGTPTQRHPKWLALPAEVRQAASRLTGQALHARILGFRHPVSGKELRFEAEPPEAFRKLLETLRGMG